MAVKTSLLSALLFSAAAFNAQAADIKTDTAKMQAMDKITGKVSLIDARVNSEVKFGSFSIVVRDCRTTSEEDIPENFAFVDVVDSSLDGKKTNIFKGWMISSSPALNAVEHPLYDVWLLKCINHETGKVKLLTEEQLKERDALPRAENDNEKIVMPEALMTNEAISDIEEPVVTMNPEPEVETTEEPVIEEPLAQAAPSIVTEPSVDDFEGAPQSLLNFSEEPIAAEKPIAAEEPVVLEEPGFLTEPSEQIQ